MTGQIAFLDDNLRSLDPFIPIAKEFGFKPKTFERPIQLGNYCEEKRSEPSLVSAFVLDMHDKKVRDLSEIRLPRVNTMNGEAVGIAIAEQYLRVPGSPFEHTPIGLLTGFRVPHDLESRIEALRIIAPLEVLPKRKGKPAFRRFMRMLSTSEVPDVVGEELEIVLRVLSEFGFSSKQRAATLGLNIVDEASWPSLLSKEGVKGSIDIPDRLEMLLDMKTKLEAIYPRDTEAQSEWLKTSQPILGNDSPFDLLVSGHHSGIRPVLALLQRVVG